jgi:hypothetical protein
MRAVLTALLLVATAALAAANEPAAFRVVVATDSAGLRGSRSFDVSPRQNIVVQTADNLYDVGAGRALLRAPVRGLGHAAFMLDGSLLAVRDDRLAYYERGALVDAAALPARGLRLAPESDTTAYLYGGSGPAAGIYRFAKPSRVLKLFDVEGVSALVAVRGRLFFAAEGGIYTAKAGEAVAAVHRDPALAIRSLDVEPKSGTVLFATDDAVYGIRAGKTSLLVEGIGGQVKVDRDLLYILSPTRGRLVVVEDLIRELSRD